MLVEAKSNLAKLMASENLYVEQRNVETAYFDLKSRILTVPMLDGNLSAELYDLLLGHEVGHALETPEKGWHDSIIDLKVNKSILNVCEDARIEKKIKRKFPGIRISFLKGYKELLEMDFFGVKNKNLKELNLIDRINLHTKCGASLGIDFTDSEDKILKEVENTETFDEVVVVARKIQELMKSEIEKLQKEQQESTENQKKKLTVILKDSVEEGESGEKLDMSEFDEVEIIDERTKDGEAGGEESDTPQDESGEEGSSGATGTSEAIESLTDKSFRKKEKELHTSDKGKQITYTNVPELLLDDIIIPYKELFSKLEKSANSPNHYNLKCNHERMANNFRKFRQESNKVVSYLVKEFELRKNADQQARAQVSRTGELNMSRLYDYKFTDDIFKRMTKVPNGKSHGLVMYVDWSGSMSEHLSSTIKQLLNLVLFCRKVNIPFEVYAFSTFSKSVFDHQGNWRTESKYKVQVPKVGDMMLEEFSLLNLFSSKMNNREFTNAATYLFDFGTGPSKTGHCANFYPPEFMRLSGTPLNQAVISAFRIVPQFKRENRLEIVNTVFLTDGDGAIMSQRYSHRDNIGSFRTKHDAVPTSGSRAVYRDTTTRGFVELDSAMSGTHTATAQTTALLKLLKQRLDCNIIGFYVCAARDVRGVLRTYTSKYDAIENAAFSFKENNFALIESSGYDEYYLLRSDKMNTDDIEFEVSSNTTRGLISSFSKYTGNKIGSRLVLNRFINLIA